MIHRISQCLTAFLLLSPELGAKEMTTPELLEQREKWDHWADSGKKLRITGRVIGHVAFQLHLQKINIAFVAEKGITVPDRMRRGQRISASGRFQKNGRRIEFSVTRFSVDDTDRENLSKALDRLPEGDVSARYQLAIHYQALADFYDDQELAGDVQKCRLRTLRTERRQNRDDAAALWQLVDPGPNFEIPLRLQQSIRFEVLALRASATRNVPTVAEVKEHLPGWNHTDSAATEQEESEFGARKVEFYESAPEPVRRRFERLFFRMIRLRELRAQIADDGSNGLTLASSIRQELPDENTAAAEFEAVYTEFLLRLFDRINRNQLQQLVTLLTKSGRDAEALQAVDRWLLLQEKRFNDRGLAGLVRVADEYLFVWENGKSDDHRDSGIRFLKLAWKSASEIAPEEAPAIANRLERLGWTRLSDRWMTREDLERLPSGHIALAERDGIVVPGMSLDQVRKILGEPSRKIRAVSSRHVEEIWVYREGFSNRISVRLRRACAIPASQATVLNVFHFSGRP